MAGIKMQKSTKLKQKLALQYKPGLQTLVVHQVANLKKIHCDVIASAINKMGVTRR